MAALTFKVGGDTSGLSRALGKARGMLGGLAGMAKKLALGGLAIGAAGAAGALAGLAVAARGVKGALDLGGALSDLSSRTGIAVGELAVLQQAFEDNGLSAEKVGPIINKMQKGISDAANGLQAPKRALAAMGLTLEELKGKTPLEQFEMLQKGLQGMEDVTLRTGAAMDIFGRSGGELQALFDDAGAIGKARTTLGGQADILQENAAAFDRTSDLLKSAGKKLQGLFVGMAEFINPILLPALEKLNQLDLSKYGQAAGRFVAVIAQAFREGALIGLLKDGLVIAAKEFVNALVKGVKGMVAFLAASLPPVVESAWAKVRDPMFWEGIRLLILSAAQGFAAIVGRALGDDEAKFLDDAAASNAEAGRTFIDVAGDGKAVGETLMEGLRAGMAAFGREMGEEGPLGTGAERERLQRVFGELARSVDKMADEREAAAAEKAAGAPVSAAAEEATQGTIVRPGAIVTSLGKIGGGLALGAKDTLDRDRNALLRNIERNTRGSTVARFA